MDKLAICTVGTSIANGCEELKNSQREGAAWVSELLNLAEQIDKKIKNIDLTNSKKIRALSAELNTLDRMKISRNDIIILLATDSALGRVCSQKLSDVLKKLYNCDVYIKQIIGLQVYDAKKLKEEGLKNLIKVVVDDYIDNDNFKHNYDIIVNPTGGYKAIVPFLSILGMLYGRHSTYVFEFAGELISLPPLPITFDISIYERAKEALKFIDKEAAVTKEAYLSKIKDFDSLEEDTFLSFTEPFEDNLITLSPLAYVFLNIDNNTKKCKISKQVQTKLQTLNSNKKVIIERLIENSSNPLWRKQKHHNWSDSDFFIIKQGNTSERLAGFMRGDIFHIALAYPNHDEYETELPKYKVSDFDDEEFMEWKAEIINENSSTDLDSLQVEYDLLTLKNKTLEEENLEVQILKEDIKDKDTKIKESMSALKNLRKEQAKLKNKVQEFENLSFFEKFKLLFA